MSPNCSSQQNSNRPILAKTVLKNVITKWAGCSNLNGCKKIEIRNAKLPNFEQHPDFLFWISDVQIARFYNCTIAQLHDCTIKQLHYWTNGDLLCCKVIPQLASLKVQRCRFFFLLRVSLRDIQHHPEAVPNKAIE